MRGPLARYLMTRLTKKQHFRAVDSKGENGLKFKNRLLETGGQMLGCHFVDGGMRRVRRSSRRRISLVKGFEMRATHGAEIAQTK